jgi:hypothetical protein
VGHPAEPLVLAGVPLVIDEIDYDQISTDRNEFVEIRNPNPMAVSLAGLALEVRNGANGVLLGSTDLSGAGAELGPGQRLVCGMRNVLATLPPGVLGVAQAFIGFGQGLLANGQGVGGFGAGGFGDLQLIHEGVALFGDLGRTGGQGFQLFGGAALAQLQLFDLALGFVAAAFPRTGFVGEGREAACAFVGLAGQAVVDRAGFHQFLTQMAKARLFRFHFGAQRRPVAQLS